MADDDDNNNDQNGNDEEEEQREEVVRAPMREYLKLAGTILLTLIVFTLVIRGCASCQSQNPFTGEPIRQVPPAPGQ